MLSSHEFIVNEVDSIYLSDLALRKTYKQHPDSEYKTHLLGLEPGCSTKFKIIPIKKKIFQVSDLNPSHIEQGSLGNCTFLSTLRTIMRRYPHIILNMIKEIDTNLVEIEFNSGKDNKPIKYRLDKTIVVPIPKSCCLQLHTFFSINNHENTSWVKLLEKALVLHFMNLGYHYSLMNIQQNGSSTTNWEGVIPSYGEVIGAIEGKDIYRNLLGCDAKHIAYNHNNSLTDIKKVFMKGELITVSFLYNDIGLEEYHSYELINFGHCDEENYVIISNPWGWNKIKSDLNQDKLNNFNFKIDMPLLRSQILRDKGIVILNEKIFNEFVKSYTHTCGLTSLELVNKNENVRQEQDEFKRSPISSFR